MKYDYILKIIRKLKARYGTQDVYELCNRMGILIDPYSMTSILLEEDRRAPATETFSVTSSLCF